MKKMKQIWGRLRAGLNRIVVSIHLAFLCLGVGVGLLVGVSAPDLFILTAAWASFALAIVLGILAVLWSLEDQRRERMAMLGVVYPEAPEK